MTAAGSADAATVERAADELVEVAAIFNVVAKREMIIRVDLVVDFDDAVVVVFGFQDRIQ